MKRTVLTLLLLAGFIMGMFLAQSCGGGGSSDGAVARTAFYTSTTGTADLSSWPEVSGLGLSGLAAADAICQARADAAGLEGAYVAWLSDDSDDAYCRVHGLTGQKSADCGQPELPADAGPWFRTDGVPFADRIDLLTGSRVIYSPVRMDEFGSGSETSSTYWTATDTAGALFLDNCSNWTSTADSSSAVILGRTEATVTLWTQGPSTTACSFERPLLCLETGTENLLPNPQGEGKTVFLSSASGRARLGSWSQAGGNTGIAAGDAVCRNLAAAAGLARADSFKAWLSDSSTDAVDRLDSSGPWVRPDGMVVAESRSALVSSRLMTSITVTENGDYVSSGVWTGTMGGGIKDTDTCSDWTSDSGGASGAAGQSSYADDVRWSRYISSPPCNLNFRLYCFED